MIKYQVKTFMLLFLALGICNVSKYLGLVQFLLRSFFSTLWAESV